MWYNLRGLYSLRSILTKGGISMKIKIAKNGAYTTFEKTFPSGYYLVKLYTPEGSLYDKILCDAYSMARDSLKSFNAIAKHKFN